MESPIRKCCDGEGLGGEGYIEGEKLESTWKFRSGCLLFIERRVYVPCGGRTACNKII